jgi:N-acyl homoserine lactone hydrolase
LAELKQAELMVSRAEWRELSGAAPEARGFLRAHITIPGVRWRQFEFAPDAGVAPFTESLDLMDDGSLLLLPTPGHTAGSVSLLVQGRTGPPLLLVGDLSYDADLLARRQVPGVGRRRQMLRSTDQVLALTERLPGLVILPAHDPGAARRLVEASS